MSRAEEAKQQIQDPAAFEHKDASAKGVILFLAGLFVTIAIVMACAAWVFGLFTLVRERYFPFPLPEKAQVPPAPRLQQAPTLDMRRLRAEEDAALETYGWVDESKGIVRIPIGRAIDLIAQRGLPVRTSPQGPLTSPPTGAPSGGPQTGAPQPGLTGMQRGGAPVTQAPQGGGSRSGGQ